MGRYIAEQGFDDNRLGNVVKRQRFVLLPAVAEKYVKKGLLSELRAHPAKARGKQLSASPAGQASQVQTAKPSRRGRKALPPEPTQPPEQNQPELNSETLQPGGGLLL